MDSSASSHASQFQHYYTLDESVANKNLEDECFQPSMEVSGELAISFNILSSNSSVKACGRVGNRSIHTSNSSCVLLDQASRLPTALNMLEGVLPECPIVISSQVFG